jgi:phosphonate transport system substrate-binding protein
MVNGPHGAGVTGASRRRVRAQARPLLAVGFFVVATMAAACGGGGDAASKDSIYIGGIPDQEVSVLEQRFNGVADYLTEQLDIPVEYVASTDYAALVTAFTNGDVPLAWFGGLTGVQARLEVEGAEAIVQRPVDQEFTSVFIVGPGVEANSLADLAGLTFTFGSETSTSGHLMPRYFLVQAGVDPETDFDGGPGYSGSHDKTWQLVESGSYQAGALNSTVWDRAVDEGAVDTSKVRVIETTQPYYDYHWVANPLLDEKYGDGTIGAIKAAFLAMGDDPDMKDVLDLFDAEGFIETQNSNYDAIEDVARQLGLIEGQ